MCNVGINWTEVKHLKLPRPYHLKRDIDRSGKWVSADCIHILPLIYSIENCLKPKFPMFAGGRRGSQHFTLNPKLPKNPNSLCLHWEGGGEGGRVVFQLLMLSPKLPKTHIPYVDTMGGGGGGGRGGREGWCPDFWCQVQNCLKPKVPMSTREEGWCPDFWCWVQNCLKPISQCPVGGLGRGGGGGW